MNNTVTNATNVASVTDLIYEKVKRERIPRRQTPLACRQTQFNQHTKYNDNITSFELSISNEIDV